MGYLPDNYDLFAQHDAEQERWLEQRPICSCCGEHIQDDRLYDINGELYCCECTEEEFSKSTDDYM